MKSELRYRNELDVKVWDAFINASPQGCVFMQSWYLDALNADWSALLVHDTEGIVAAMPLVIRRKLGLSYALQPILTKYGGIALRPDDPSVKVQNALSIKNQAVKALVAAIPDKLASFHINFHPAFDYPLPFHWHGYALHQLITYRLACTPEAELWEHLHSNLRRNIRKAEKAGMTVKESFALDPLVHLLEENRRAGKTILPQNTYLLLANILRAGAEKGQARLYTVEQSGETAAAAFIVNDAHYAYYLTSATALAHRSSGAGSLLLYHAIRSAFANDLHFDLMGSMRESIEQFFRSFGGTPAQFLSIRKEHAGVRALRSLRR